MRYIAGQACYTVSEVASSTGVSAQTVREWERLGYLAARRTADGHRLFSEEAPQSASDQVALRRRRRVSDQGQPPADAPALAWELASTGAGCAPHARTRACHRPGCQTHRWRNPASGETQVLWVEALAGPATGRSAGGQE